MEPKPPDKAKTLGMFFAVLGISCGFWWSLHWVPEGHDVLYLVLCFAGAGSVIALPLLAAWWKPHIAAFQRAWVPRKRSDYIWAGFLVLASIAWAVGAALLTLKLGLPRVQKFALRMFPGTPVFVLLAAFARIVIGPVAEEVFWRGYALDQFQKLMPRPYALLLQAAGFAAVHLYNIWGTIVVFGYGLLWGLWRQRRQTLVPVIVGHLAVNALALGYPYYRSYQEAVRWQSVEGKMDEVPEELEGPLRSMLQELEEKFDRGRNSPQGKQIDALARRPMDRAVPGIIKFLGDDDEDVQSYAYVVLAARFGDRASAYYAKALDSEDPRIVREVISLIGQLECKELAPRVHTLVMRSPNLRVQISGVITLGELLDMDSLKDIAANHPNDKVRLAAKRCLSRGGAPTSGSTTTSQAAP